MDMNFESAIESPCGKFCDYVTVFTPVAVLGVFLISRTYLKLDTYAVSAFCVFLFAAVLQGVEVHCSVVD